MAKIAFMFPGQGSQSSGMGMDLCEKFSSAKEVFDVADKVLGYSISKICFSGSDEELKLTINSQPAILATSLAAYRAFESVLNIKPDYVLGHSLGEIAAYNVAGVLSLEDTFKLIQKRAEFMNEAAFAISGSMAAILNADINLINECIEKVSGIVSVANYNSPSQVVITGECEAVDSVCNLLKENGVKRVIPLAVSGAFHSLLMKDASEKFADVVNEISFLDANIPVVTNVDANLTNLGNDFEKKVVEQVYSSVRWCESIQKLVDLGVDTFVEFGEGTVLSGLVKKIYLDAKVYNVSNSETLRDVAEKLGEIYVRK